MSQQHLGRLTAEERAERRRLISAGAAPARQLARARVLLKADRAGAGPALSDRAVAAAVEVSPRTVARVRAQFATGGLAAALARQRPRRVYARKLDGAGEARLIALACATPPEGFARWSLRLLANGLVEAEVVTGIAPNTVRAVLKKTCSSPG